MGLTMLEDKILKEKNMKNQLQKIFLIYLTFGLTNLLIINLQHMKAYLCRKMELLLEVCTVVKEKYVTLKCVLCLTLCQIQKNVIYL